MKLLPICGHLMCQKCMFKGHNENQIKCPKCKKVSRIDFLGSISSSKNQLESRVEDEKPIICQKHAKEAQGEIFFTTKNFVFFLKEKSC